METGQTEEAYVKALQKQHYRFFGPSQHSAAKLCLWTKKSIRNQGICYKQKFYGINSHRCLQMTPNVYCNQKCVFCWRAWEHTPPNYTPSMWDKPEKLVSASIEAQRKLLEGFYGAPDLVNKEKLDEAQHPNQVAISLAGEPTMYPYIDGLIGEYNKRNFTTFLVTNGLLPDRLQLLRNLPTQLYVSLDAPNENVHRKVNVPQIKDSWKRINKTLELLPKINTRRVIRITAVRDWNILDPEAYARLIEKARPDFVEVKAYMAVGSSRLRKGLGMPAMPLHNEIVDFTKKINEYLDYKWLDEKEDSRVVLLGSGEKDAKINK